MKHMMKRFVLAVLMVFTLAALTSCGSAANTSGIDPDTEANLASIATENVGQMLQMADDQLDSTIAQAQQGKQTAIVTGLQEWKNLKPEMGDFVTIDSTKTKVQEVDAGYIVSLEITCTNRNGRVVFGVDKNITQINQLAVNKVETLPEKLKSAGLNLVIGMIVVFAVLIFISWIISLFKYINVWETKRLAKEKESEAADSDVTVSGPSEQTEALEDTVAADDSELVAVITAAIAASENTCSDGLVVRSIKRVPNSRWKRA